MSENVKEEKKSSNKTIIILLIIVILLLLAAGIIAVVFIMKKDADLPDQGDNGGLIQYEAGIINYEDAQKEYDEMQKRADEGMVGVHYSNIAKSEDGTHFTCFIENPIRNGYDMYLNIYKDDTMTEQILLTGLIPAGSGIEEFESEIPLEPGDYKSVLVMTLVEDDHSTLHAQSKVYLNLYVGE